jgi:hypothetical protein
MNREIETSTTTSDVFYDALPEAFPSEGPPWWIWAAGIVLLLLTIGTALNLETDRRPTSMVDKTFLGE